MNSKGLLPDQFPSEAGNKGDKVDRIHGDIIVAREIYGLKSTSKIILEFSKRTVPCKITIFLNKIGEPPVFELDSSDSSPKKENIQKLK